MQKNFNFVKSDKRTAIISGVVVILLSFLLSNFTLSIGKPRKSAIDSQNEPLYLALRNTSNKSGSNSKSLVEMNNLLFENSNFEETNLQSVEFSGVVRLLDSKTGVVSPVPIEDYVLGVLSAEMPQSFEMQALMAQAVAVRTFAVRSASVGSKHADADVCDDFRCCQSLCDVENCGFDVTRAAEAVKATRGIIAVYDGKPILAVYHASSFGRTKSSAEVWGGSVDYLVSVVATESKDVTAHTAKFSENKLKSLLNAEKNPIFRFGDDGLCTHAEVDGKIVTASELRRMLGLRSDSFETTECGGEYIFTSYGYGHGVGMSQHGANALAKSGCDFYEILRYYYSGIGFEML